MMINSNKSRVKLPIPGVFSQTALKMMHLFIRYETHTRHSYRRIISAIQDVNFDEEGVMTLYCNDNIKWRAGYYGNDLAKAKVVLKKIGYAFKEMIKDFFRDYHTQVKTEEGLAATHEFDLFKIDRIYDMTLPRIAKSHGAYGSVGNVYCEVNEFYNNWNYEMSRAVEKEPDLKEKYLEHCEFSLKQFRCMYELLMDRDQKKLKRTYGEVYTELVGEERNPFEKVQLAAYNTAVNEENKKFEMANDEVNNWYRRERDAMQKKLDAIAKEKREAILKQYNENCVALRAQFGLVEEEPAAAGEAV